MGIDNKTKKNASYILALENKLTQKEDTINENERELFFDNKKISKWKSTSIFSYSDYYSMKGIENTKKEMPILKNDERMYVYLQGSHFQENNVLTKSCN